MLNKKYRVLGIACSLVSTTLLGCSDNSARLATMEMELNAKDRQIMELESSLQQRESSVSTLESELKGHSQRAARRAGSNHAELPPVAKAGECYARVFVQPTFKATTEQVLRREASEKIELVPAQYEWVEEKVLVKEASEQIQEIPAEYGWVEERVLVEDAATKLENLPAEYRDVEEKVRVKAAHNEWKKGRGLIERMDAATGEIMCLVEVPAEYRTITKRVLAKPASVKKVAIPAKYTTVKKRVVTRPATVKKVAIPAEYDTVKVKKLIQPETTKRHKVPAEYDTLTKTVKASEGHMEWRRVLCETNANASTISKIQSALQDAGYDPGSTNGVLDEQTFAAIRDFQKEEDLPVGTLTYETIESLGLSLN